MKETGTVFIIHTSTTQEPTELSVQWALDQLRGSLEKRGLASQIIEEQNQESLQKADIVVADTSTSIAQQILAEAGTAVPNIPESIGIVPRERQGKNTLLITGSDTRGLMYGLLELVDRIEYAEAPLEALGSIEQLIEKPFNPIRGVSRHFQSEVEDKPWFYDKTFWQRYLSMLATHRFNRFHLSFGLGYDRPTQIIDDAYFLFLYPFLVDVPGYDVRVQPFSIEEREQNLSMLKYISEQAAARGIDFYLGIWHQAYNFPNSPNINYAITGLTPEIHTDYCRDALHTLLEACPAIKGVTFRAHDESGIPDGSHQFWHAFFDGLVKCSRPIEIDLHTKEIDHALLNMAVATGLPVNVSTKFSSEHMGLPYHQASIRERERSREGRDEHERTKKSRSFTRYGYGDYLIENRSYGVWHRMWPGTQRMLLWGDPKFASAYSRVAGFCGSLGMEVCEPLSFKGRQGSGSPGGRELYADVSLSSSGGDWEKYLYTYRLWGRLLFNPDANPESWQRYLRHEFGKAASSMELALAHASRILPLVTSSHLESAANNHFWPEMYANMPIVHEYPPLRPFIDTPEPRRFNNVSPLDPALFNSINEFADELVSGKRSGKYSPLDVANWLEGLAAETRQQLAAARKQLTTEPTPAFRRFEIDASVQSELGYFFADKFRAGVSYALYERTTELGHLKEALKHYDAALSAWRRVVVHTQYVYCANLAFGGGPDYLYSPAAHRRGHWVERLTAIEQDLNDMHQEWLKASNKAEDTNQSSISLDSVSSPTTSFGNHLQLEHSAPSSFIRGKPLLIELSLKAPPPTIATVRLYYRLANQAEAFQVQEVSSLEGDYQAVIPAKYTDSPYPLIYFFELQSSDGTAWLYPGLGAELANQPYYVVRQA